MGYTISQAFAESGSPRIEKIYRNQQLVRKTVGIFRE